MNWNWLQRSPDGVKNCVLSCMGGSAPSCTDTVDMNDSNDTHYSDIVSRLASGKWEGRLGLKNATEKYMELNPHLDEPEFITEAKNMSWVAGGVTNTAQLPPSVANHTHPFALWNKCFRDLKCTDDTDLTDLVRTLNLSKSYSKGCNIENELKFMPSYEEYDHEAASDRNRKRALEMSPRLVATYPVAAAPLTCTREVPDEHKSLFPGLQHIAILVQNTMYANTPRLINTHLRAVIKWNFLATTSSPLVLLGDANCAAVEVDDVPFPLLVVSIENLPILGLPGALRLVHDRYPVGVVGPPRCFATWLGGAELFSKAGQQRLRPSQAAKVWHDQMKTVACELWQGHELRCKSINLLGLTPPTQLHRTDSQQQAKVDGMLHRFNSELNEIHKNPIQVGFDVIATDVDASQIAKDGTLYPIFATSVLVRACQIFAASLE